MTTKSIKRIQKDIKLYHQSDINDHGIYVYFNEKNIFNAKALILGPKESPYQNGFYLFDIVYPESYPQHPPKVKLMTLSSKTRFNPNLYTDGKVCLSILGTWSGPGWTPCLSTNEVMLSIQSLMNNNPIQNEPGYEKLTLEKSTEARNYVHILNYHNHRYAILQILDKIPGGFEYFKEIIHQKFIELYEENLNNLQTNKDIISKIDSLPIKLRMYNLSTTPKYDNLIKMYEEYYNYFNKIPSGNPGQGEQVLCDKEKTAPKEEPKPSEPKRRTPDTPASDFEVGHVLVSNNDQREYMVKLVKGRGGNEHKRWILKK